MQNSMVRRQRLRVFVAALILASVLIYSTQGLRASRERNIGKKHPQSAHGNSAAKSDNIDVNDKPVKQPDSQNNIAEAATKSTSTTLSAATRASSLTAIGAVEKVQEPPITQIYAFGDSYTSYGFSHDQSAPTLQNAHGNRFPMSGELCPFDQLTTCSYKWLDFVLSYFSASSTVSMDPTGIQNTENRTTALAWNFARGSSTVDGDLIWPEYPAARSLVDQVRQYTEMDKQRAQSQANRDSRGTSSSASSSSDQSRLDLYTIFFGINDIANTAQKEDVNLEELYTAVMKTYVGEMEHLYQQGARNFLLFNVPPVDRTPELLDSSEEDREQVQMAVKLFNTLLESISVGDPSSQTGLSFAERHVDAKVMLLDMQSVFHGFLNADSDRAWCVQDENADSSCAWLDKFHPVEALQRVIGVEVVKAMQRIPLLEAPL